jgi:hypothetical protein
MPTQVLGSDTFSVVPTVGSDPVMIAVSGGVPSVLAGAGAPSTAPAYGAGSLYVDTANYNLYVYGTSWTLIGDTTLVLSVSTSTTAASLPNVQYIYLVSGTTTLTLPTAVGNLNTYTIKNVGNNTVTIATTSSQTIDGSTTALLKVKYTSLTLVSDNANWNII